MWIRKKKFQQKLDDVKFSSYMDALDEKRELNQQQRIYKLEKQVKKLKKQIKKGY